MKMLSKHNAKYSTHIFLKCNQDLKTEVVYA